MGWLVFGLLVILFGGLSVLAWIVAAFRLRWGWVGRGALAVLLPGSIAATSTWFVFFVPQLVDGPNPAEASLLYGVFFMVSFAEGLVAAGIGIPSWILMEMNFGWRIRDSE